MTQRSSEPVRAPVSETHSSDAHERRIRCPRMQQLIGILGGVASGKSLVAGQLAALGAGVLDADAPATRCCELPEVEASGPRALGRRGLRTGRPDRPAAAGPNRLCPTARGGPRERKYLEQLTHPEIGRLLREQVEALAADRACRRWCWMRRCCWRPAGTSLCDRMVFVDAPREARLARAAARGWSEEDLRPREAAQESLDAKRAAADVVIDNSGSPEATAAQVERFWRSLVEPLGRHQLTRSPNS